MPRVTINSYESFITVTKDSDRYSPIFKSRVVAVWDYNASNVRITYYPLESDTSKDVDINIGDIVDPVGLQTAAELRSHLLWIISLSMTAVGDQDNVVLAGSGNRPYTVPSVRYNTITEALNVPHLKLTGEIYQWFTIPAQAWYASQTNGTSKLETETATYKRTIKGWDYVSGSDKSAEFALKLPDWEPSTLSLNIVWFAKSSASNGETVEWKLGATSSGPSESFDQQFTENTNTVQIANVGMQEESIVDLDLSSFSSGDWITLRLKRVGSSDTGSDSAVMLETSLLFRFDGENRRQTW